jgi:acyl-ACP thioesterase
MHDVQLQTWCGGYGSHWAERRTRITSDDGGLIEAAALWVHVDMQTMKPTPLPEDFFTLVHESSGGRKIRANLAIGKSLPPLDDPGAISEEWQVRFADMDAVGHLNNASYWIALEEYLSQHSGRRAPMHATVEHHLPIDPGQQVRIVTQELPERTVLRHVINATDVAAVTQIVAL